jgi:hypothetical protein
MSLASDLRDLLTAHSALTSLVSERVSPYLRNRDDPFPGITFEIGTEELITATGNTVQDRKAEATITVHARSFNDAETIGAAVLGAIEAVTPAGDLSHVRPMEVERTYEEPYDGSTDLVYRWALTVHLKG